jgi:hypothetical protein
MLAVVLAGSLVTYFLPVGQGDQEAHAPPPAMKSATEDTAPASGISGGTA